LTQVKIVDGTVPYNLNAKYKSAKIMVHPATTGT
jgi:ribosomal protein S5